ncbi:MAG: ribonuclease H-like domain-containing protein [Dehalococcoidia bacterium]|nr:ribonuclease H-like domain-containing protein [Dehalococcoidia bacterium]
MFDRPASSPLRDRLRAALHQPVRREPVVRAESVTELTDLSALGGRWFQSPDGPGYVIESVYEAGHAHGNVVLHRALSLDLARLAGQARDPRLGEREPGDLVYVDTETTGLGGAGAMVFLAGVARFEGSLLRLRQYLLPGPQFEGGLLGGFAGELASAGALVSYNGKSFDLPLLEARYILSRQRPTFRELPHLDLLHPNRRLFRGEFDSHKLAHMEVQLLGFEREADCPSHEVPERYFRFQRTSDPTHILPVLRHNAWDVLSLVALAAHLAAVVDGHGRPLQAARAAQYAGDFGAALRHYEAAIAGGLGRAQRLEAMEQAARCCRKLELHDEAAAWWERILAEPRGRRVLPYVELAKHAEHRSRDFAHALRLVDEALALLSRGLVRPGRRGSETSAEALRHRRARLTARLARS